ncbi:MAG TPA: efflux RND transporter periplasmic adaptor subunit [Thermoanaerobaculia bacterium]|nr:efflux RND transporter periplasmic adaptor subunit [Thermoanaerobaculia bacterium]
MDIKREGVVEAKRRKRILYGALTVLGVVALTAWLWQLEPAPPTIPRSSVYPGTVERGEMVRQVRGPGNLVPVDIRWITAQTQGKVERKVILPGAQVEPDTIILELSNPELESSTQDTFLALQRAEADFQNLKAQLDTQLLNDRSALAAVESDYQQAALQAEADATLTEDGLIPELTAKLSKLRAETLENRYAIEKDRFESSRRSTEARLNAGEAELAQARALYELRRSQYEALQVRAGIRGVLQQVPVEVGQQVAPGAQLARVARPEELKAELRIAETQAKDVTIGQKAEIDTRNGIIPGRVIRIDPAVINGSVTVDVALEGELPPGARPDLSVDGTVELERLVDVLYMGRPAYGQANSKIGLFRLDPGGDTATRVQVELGRTSVTTVEIVSGLLEGDRVILSDTSQWEDFDRVRLGG